LSKCFFFYFSIEREPSGDGENRKEAEENKENVRQDNCFTDASGIIYDMDDWNESVISGGCAAQLLKTLYYVCTKPCFVFGLY